MTKALTGWNRVALWKDWLWRLEFKLEDVWVGFFWKSQLRYDGLRKIKVVTEIWLCLLPCLPLHFHNTNPKGVEMTTGTIPDPDYFDRLRQRAILKELGRDKSKRKRRG